MDQVGCLEFESGVLHHSHPEPRDAGHDVIWLGECNSVLFVVGLQPGNALSLLTQSKSVTRCMLVYSPES